MGKVKTPNKTSALKISEGKKGTRIVTPPIELVGFVALSQPYTGNDPDGKYSVPVRFKKGSPEAIAFMQLVEQEHDKSVQEKKAEQPNAKKAAMIKEADLPYRDELDDDGNETGYIVAYANMRAKVHSKKSGKTFDFRPTIVDTQRQPIPGSVRIGAGTTAKVAFDLEPYYVASAGAGVCLRLVGAMITDLVEYSGAGKVASMFDVEEDGYVFEGKEGTGFDDEEKDEDTDKDDTSDDF